MRETPVIRYCHVMGKPLQKETNVPLLSQHIFHRVGLFFTPLTTASEPLVRKTTHLKPLERDEMCFERSLRCVGSFEKERVISPSAGRVVHGNPLCQLNVHGTFPLV